MDSSLVKLGVLAGVVIGVVLLGVVVFFAMSGRGNDQD